MPSVALKNNGTGCIFSLTLYLSYLKLQSPAKSLMIGKHLEHHSYFTYIVPIVDQKLISDDDLD